MANPLKSGSFCFFRECYLPQAGGFAVEREWAGHKKEKAHLIDAPLPKKKWEKKFIIRYSIEYYIILLTNLISRLAKLMYPFHVLPLKYSVPFGIIHS